MSEAAPRPCWSDRIPKVDADPARVEQIVGNVLSNANKYTEPGGRIRLALESEAGQAVIRVRDNGAGIDARLLPHIFEPFTQADSSAARSKGGLGIGLALVPSLVELHGGSVTARSDGPGTGTEVVVRLPLAINPQRREISKRIGRVAIIVHDEDSQRRRLPRARVLRPRAWSSLLGPESWRR